MRPETEDTPSLAYLLKRPWQTLESTRSPGNSVLSLGFICAVAPAFSGYPVPGPEKYKIQ
jgi:hypothetical protein